jgi:ABC-type glycerol-3-phosphate transport system substrate-binding protein
MKTKSTLLCIAAVAALTACASPAELRNRQVTFAASSTTPNAEKSLTCVAKGWEQATQQAVTVTKLDNGYTAYAESRTLWGMNTDFVIDSGNARTGGAVFQLWSTMKQTSTDKLIAIIQPCL